ncbi:hypothetical protein XELAEV_18028017mg [Xenopus laevis]|uniref:Uncharacterized protein n=1 Tax=Xenopus laevis TaxID=8355 RepID=A0A974CXD3_XENLA|nr:hypothetical protein XELAEV_18028017mg [Xenopus laevis]
MQMHSVNHLLCLNIAFTLYLCLSKTFRPNVCFTICHNCLLKAESITILLYY